MRYSQGCAVGVLACAFIVIVLFLISGCGSQSAGASSGAGTTPGASPTPTPTPTPTPSPSPSPSPSPTPASQPGPVVLVVEENHSFDDVITNSGMPFLKGLAAQNSLATQYFADTHPSIGNYFMMTTGQIITNDDSFSGPVAVDNIVRHLIQAGKTWKAYAESLPSTGYIGGDTGDYLHHHNPCSYFTDVVNSSTEQQNLVPFTQFAQDMSNGQLPDFSFVAPNILDDAHNGTLLQADQWLQANIAPLLSNPQFANGGLLLIVFDESEDTDTTLGGGHVALVLAGPAVKSGFQSANQYQHQNLLKLITTYMGIDTNLGAAENASSMSEFLK